MDRIRKNIPTLVKNLGPDRGRDFVRCILTTDTFPKIVQHRQKIGGKTVTIVGVCKGAGMIMPQMATTLSFIFTDLSIPPRLLKPLFQTAVDESFNRITVDGDMSTNDTSLCLANGRAGNSRLQGKTLRSAESLLVSILKELARMIILDGEGATKLVEIQVVGARTRLDADRAAYAVANSPLVKTAINGSEVNWGRIIAAVGRSGVKINPDRIDIDFDRIPVVRSSRGRPETYTLARGVLKKKEIKIRINLHQGKCTTSLLTCDLSTEYVRINAGYLS
jgi:glutamate N-acetyltransferase/amino-acid N-acetyltransferase